MRIHRPGERLIVASTAGDGFIVPEDEVLAQTRSGKQVLNVKDGVKALLVKPVTGDHVAVVGENRKVLVFPLEELPEMTRGKGVRLQKLQGRRAVGSDDAGAGNGPVVARSRRSHPNRDGALGMAGQAGRHGPHGPARFPPR